MDRPAKEIIDRLGPAGLSRVLEDLLDRKQLVSLATACGLQYPGIRTQSQTRERLVRDLVKKARGADARTTIVRVLAKKTTQAGKDWRTLSPEDRARRLADDEVLLAVGKVGLHLFLVAESPDATDPADFGSLLARERLLRVASNGAGSEAREKASREEERLRRQLQARERKLDHLDSQLAKARETQKKFKRDLIERKGELAESRMLAERLRKDLTEAQRKAQAAAIGKPNPDATGQTVTELSKTVKKLVSEQKKLAHGVRKLTENRTVPRAAPEHGALEKSIDELRQEFVARGKKELKEFGDNTKRVESLLAEIRANRKKAPARAEERPSKRTRPRGASARVGVFIDVQNMYYAARLLKGKLDFDALMQAAVNGRRLIKATAYVVETKEIDQSQFIAMLQKRAIEVRRKTLRIRVDGSMKGDWDMELALDILDAAPDLDVVVLVSGDGDFTSLAKRVKSMGPRVEVIAFPRNTAKSLVGAADHFQPLDRKFMIYPKRSKRPMKNNVPPTPRPGASSSDPAKK